MISIWFQCFKHIFWSKSMSSASFVEDFQIISSYTGLVHSRLIMKLPRGTWTALSATGWCVHTYMLLFCTIVHTIYTYVYIYVQFMTPVVLNKKHILVFSPDNLQKMNIFGMDQTIVEESDLQPGSSNMISRSLQVPVPYCRTEKGILLQDSMDKLFLVSFCQTRCLCIVAIFFCYLAWLLSSDSTESFCTEKSLGNHHFSLKNHGQHHSGSVLYLGCQEQKMHMDWTRVLLGILLLEKTQVCNDFPCVQQKLHKDLPSSKRTCPHPRYVWSFFFQKKVGYVGGLFVFFGG